MNDQLYNPETERELLGRGGCSEMATGEGRWRDNYREVNHKAMCLYKEFKWELSKE